MTKNFNRCAVAMICISSIPMISSCVDEDYDLSKDIDMTVQVGGNMLTIPASSTDWYNLSQILDLDSESSIKEVAYDDEYPGLKKGDYALIQSGDPTESEFEISTVEIKSIKGNITHTVLPEFYNLPGDVKLTSHTDPVKNNIDMDDDDVTTEIVSLESARMNVQIEFSVSYISNDFSGNAYVLQGYVAEFPDTWQVSVTDAATADYLQADPEHKNRLVFTRDCMLPINAVVNVDYMKFEQGQGLVSPGHFLINDDVTSWGDVSLGGVDDTHLPVGSRANLTLVTETNVRYADILSVTGVVDPKIDVDNMDFEFTDIPDFLSEKDNNLELDNPRIYVNVLNTSAVEATLNAELTPYIDGLAKESVGIGAKYGTTPVVIAPATTTRLVIQQKDEAVDGATSIVVPDLSEKLISSIPDRIEFHNIEVKATDRVITFELGTIEHFNCDYEAVVPLAFGPNMFLTYSEEESGWGSDLGDYNFGELEVLMDVENALPLNMIPDAVPIDAEGKEISDVEVTIVVDNEIKMIAAGNQDKPEKSTMSILIKSVGKNLANLDGVKLTFKASADQNCAGVNLNKAQGMRFDNIRIVLRGGITVDLNEL